MAYKTTRKKTGVNSYETKTYNTKTGTRITRTVKPTKSLTISNSIGGNGRSRRTVTNNINGWVTRKTQTHSTPKVKSYKPRKTKSPRVSSGRRRSGGSISGMAIFCLIMCFIIVAYFPETLPYVLSIVAVIGAIWLFFILLPWLVWGGIIIGVVYLISLFA